MWRSNTPCTQVEAASQAVPSAIHAVISSMIEGRIRQRSPLSLTPSMWWVVQLLVSWEGSQHGAMVSMHWASKRVCALVGSHAPKQDSSSPDSQVSSD